MQIRISRVLSALVVAAVGFMALRRTDRRDVPVAPGSWEPADDAST
jgi:hypothetical protein